ncbi:hypothetical protein LZL36_11110 [Pseudomonas aeruginosa]|nr:hypothetical protein [Pseudomonas aeruginosa]
MISDVDKESLRKAHDKAVKLVDELQTLPAQKMHCWPKLGGDILKSAAEIEQKLKRISLANHSES